MKSIICPFCENTDFISVCRINLGGLSEREVVRCTNCRLAFVNPLPTEDELQRFYVQQYFLSDDPRWGFCNYFANRKSQYLQGRIIARRLRRWKPHGRVLDVGCATGFLLEGIRDHCTWEVFGIEISEWAVKIARTQLGLNVTLGTLEKAEFPDNFFDIILLNDILEHVRDPLQFLTTVYARLASGGKVFLRVPNGRCDILPFVQDYQKGYVRVQTQAHLYYFEPEVLQRILIAIGFRIDQVTGYGLKAGLKDLGILRRKTQVFEKTNLQQAQSETIISDKKHGLLEEWSYRLTHLPVLPFLRSFAHELHIWAKKI
ncbi:hypothetical protein DRQ15_01710 [candidate division KSB1 bacterium]|nr:MAG: hypothetical protein DRQ15_01710 [candidate division KSB1 bacterium]